MRCNRSVVNECMKATLTKNENVTGMQGFSFEKNKNKCLRVPSPSFLVKSFLKTVSLIMSSGDRLGVDTSITVSMSSIGRTVKFLSSLRETCSSENCQNFNFIKNFKNMLIRFAMKNCPQNPQKPKFQNFLVKNAFVKPISRFSQNRFFTRESFCDKDFGMK
jgi:hypothetical protein